MYTFSDDYCGIFPPSGPAAAADFRAGLAHLLELHFEVPGSTAASIAAAVAARMSDAALHYHTPVHVLAMLQYAERRGIVLSPAEAATIFLHDSVYFPGAPPGVNELASRRMAEAMLSPFVSADALAEIGEHIEATALYLEPRVEPRHALILDLDVSNVLWPCRAVINAAIEREFLPYCRAPGDFQTARRAFLERFLAKGFVFRSPHFAADNARALEVVRGELAASDPPPLPQQAR